MNGAISRVPDSSGVGAATTEGDQTLELESGPVWRTPDTVALLEAILTLDDLGEAERFFRDLCTLGELHDLGQRWAVVRLLDEGMHYGDISRRTGASTATITRIASWLHHGEGGYRFMVKRQRARQGPDAGRSP